MRYVCSVVRFVPDIVRGEALNLGIVVGSDDSSEWELKRVDNLRRVRAFDERGVLPQAVAYLEELAALLDDYTEAVDQNAASSIEFSEERLRSLASHSSNLLQWTAPLPLIADRLQEAVELSAAQFLMDTTAGETVAGRPTSERSPTKYAALAATRQAFIRYGLKKGRDFAVRPDVAGAHGHEIFDFVVLNGIALQLVQAWSFQTSGHDDLSRRIRAWAWAVKGIRDSGGYAVADNRNVEIRKDVSVAALYVAPASGAEPQAWEDAKTAFAELQVTSIPFDRADEVGAEAARLVAGAVR